MQTLMCFFAAILTLGLAFPASSNTAFIAFAAFYGFAQGAYVALMPAQTAFLAPMERIGTYVGVIFAVSSMAGLVGNPIAGAIAKTKVEMVNVFAGVLLLAGAGMFTVTRFHVAGWKVMAKV